MALVAVSMCSACHEDRACTAIGAEPGVSFDLTDVLTHHPVDVGVCVEETCVHRHASRGRWEWIFVEDQTLMEPGVATVSVVVKRRITGQTLMQDRSSDQLHEFQPNGPGCPPSVYQAAFEVRPDGIHPLPT